MIFLVIYNKNERKIHVYIYQRLRDLREDLDLKQADIAQVLNTTREQYSRWERGANEIPLHHMITLARFYKVSMDYIVGLTNNKKGTWTR